VSGREVLKVYRLVAAALLASAGARALAVITDQAS
jgi:hypothetical protein